MVQQEVLNDVFKSLADPTRRDILSRLMDRQQTISELAENYKMSFSATAKHIRVLERAKLVTKTKQGKEQIITINGKSIEHADEYLKKYAELWTDRLDALEKLIIKES